MFWPIQLYMRERERERERESNNYDYERSYVVLSLGDSGRAAITQ